MKVICMTQINNSFSTQILGGLREVHTFNPAGPFKVRHSPFDTFYSFFLGGMRGFVYLCNIINLKY